MLKETVVAATKSGETKLQKTPLEACAFTDRDLDRNLALNVKAIAAFFPRMRVSQVATSAMTAIRGVGSHNVAQRQAYTSSPLCPRRLQRSIAVDYPCYANYDDNLPATSQSKTANHGAVWLQLPHESSNSVDMTAWADSRIPESPEFYDQLAPYPPHSIGASIIGNYQRAPLNTPQTDYQHTGGVSRDIHVRLAENYSLRSIRQIAMAF